MDPRKTAIVTGAGQGIGRAIAQRLLARGMRVVIAEVDEAAGRAAQQELAGSGPVDFVHTDVADEEAVAALVRTTVERAGRIDALVNNAAIADPGTGPLEALSLAEWNRRIGANLTSVFLCAKHTLPHLRAARGRIVNIASTRAMQAEPDTEAYVAAKGGVVALTHALAVSLGPQVLVNCVSPGWIDVSGWKWGHPPPQALRAVDHTRHPAGRVGVPEDVAALVAYLLLDEPGFLTGQDLVLDGGMTRRMIYAP